MTARKEIRVTGDKDSTGVGAISLHYTRVGPEYNYEEEIWLAVDEAFELAADLLKELARIHAD